MCHFRIICVCLQALFINIRTEAIPADIGIRRHTAANIAATGLSEEAVRRTTPPRHHKEGELHVSNDRVDDSPPKSVQSLSDMWSMGNDLLRLVTVETRDEKHKFRLNNISNLGLGVEWRGFDTKLDLMLKWLVGLSPDTLAIFVDGADTLYGGCSEDQFLRDYKSIVQRSGKQVVIGAERGCYELPTPWTCQDMPVVPASAYRNWSLASGGEIVRTSPLDHTGQARFLNSGFVVGPAGQLVALYTRALAEMRKCWGKCIDIKECNHRCHGDQYYITKDFLAHLNASNSNVTLDYGANLVTNGYSLQADKLFLLQEATGILRSTVTEQPVCFFHANGPSKKMAKRLRQWQLSGARPW